MSLPADRDTMRGMVDALASWQPCVQGGNPVEKGLAEAVVAPVMDEKCGFRDDGRLRKPTTQMNIVRDMFIGFQEPANVYHEASGNRREDVNHSSNEGCVNCPQ